MGKAAIRDRSHKCRWYPLKKDMGEWPFIIDTAIRFDGEGRMYREEYCFICKETRHVYNRRKHETADPVVAANNVLQ